MNDTKTADATPPAPQAFVAAARISSKVTLQVLRLTETGEDYAFLNRITAISAGQRALTRNGLPPVGRPSAINPFNIREADWSEVTVA